MNITSAYFSAFLIIFSEFRAVRALLPFPPFRPRPGPVPPPTPESQEAGATALVVQFLETEHARGEHDIESDRVPWRRCRGCRGRCDTVRGRCLDVEGGGGCPSERLLHVPHGMDGEAADQFLRLRYPGPAVVLWGALLVVFYWRAYDVLPPT